MSPDIMFDKCIRIGKRIYRFRNFFFWRMMINKLKKQHVFCKLFKLIEFCRKQIKNRKLLDNAWGMNW
jgi:hypothetical protein